MPIQMLIHVSVHVYLYMRVYTGRGLAASAEQAVLDEFWLGGRCAGNDCYKNIHYNSRHSSRAQLMDFLADLLD